MMSEVVQLISNVGFPIAMCLIMIFGQKKTLEDLKNTIDKNTSMVEKLIDKIEREKE